MKKKIVTIMIATAIMATMVAGCGTKKVPITDGANTVTIGGNEVPQEPDGEVTEAINGTEMDASVDADAMPDADEYPSIPRPETTEGDTILLTFANTIDDGSFTTTNAIATAVMENIDFPFMADVFDVEPGYLAGFAYDITEFTSATAIGPMIGTIPFISYVFETENPDALVESLQNAADVRWNICTIADEFLVEARGNYVYCVLSPYVFERDDAAETGNEEIEAYDESDEKYDITYDGETEMNNEVDSKVDGETIAE